MWWPFGACSGLQEQSRWAAARAHSAAVETVAGHVGTARPDHSIAFQRDGQRTVVSVVNRQSSMRIVAVRWRPLYIRPLLLEFDSIVSSVP